MSIFPKEIPEEIRQAKIVIVDDTQIMRALLSRHLRSAGFEHVTELSDGNEVVDYLSNNHVDFMLLDLMMPGMDGYETLQALSEADKLNDMAIVVVTGVDEIESVARCIELGAADYMPKLLNPILLNARIISNLRLLYMQRQLDAMNEPVAVAR